MPNTSIPTLTLTGNIASLPHFLQRLLLQPCRHFWKEERFLDGCEVVRGEGNRSHDGWEGFCRRRRGFGSEKSLQEWGLRVRKGRLANLSHSRVAERERVHDMSPQVVVAAPVLLLGLGYDVQQTHFLIPAKQNQPAECFRHVTAKQ